MDWASQSWNRFYKTLEGKKPSFTPAPETESALKKEGNELFKTCRFYEAVEKYTQAIEQSETPDYLLYSNRALAYSRLGNWRQAQVDALHSVTINEGFIKGYRTLARAYKQLGLVMDAYLAVCRGLQYDPRDAELLKSRLSIVQLIKSTNDFVEAKINALPRDEFYDREVALVEHASHLAPVLLQNKFDAFNDLFGTLPSDIHGFGAFALCDLARNHELFDLDLRRDMNLTWLAPEKIVEAFNGLTALLSTFNDAVAPDFDRILQSPSANTAVNMLKEYQEASRRQCNLSLDILLDEKSGCMFLPLQGESEFLEFVPIKYKLVVRKDIKKGDELCYHYEVTHWLGMYALHAHESGDEATRKKLDALFLHYVRRRVLGSADESIELMKASWDYRTFSRWSSRDLKTELASKDADDTLRVWLAAGN